MSEVLTITSKFNPSTGNIDFFTKVDPGTDQIVLDALQAQEVNLSRGHVRMYSLLKLSAHNGTGACWLDGQEIHTAKRQEAYVARVNADIAAAIKRAKEAAVKAAEAKRFDTATVVVATATF